MRLQRMDRHGASNPSTLVKGEDKHNAVWTSEDYITLRKYIKSGFGNGGIASLMGRSRKSIQSAIVKLKKNPELTRDDKEAEAEP